MKILIVSKCPTHPTDAGNRRFILNQIQTLKRLGHIVHFLYIDERPLLSKKLDRNLNNSLKSMNTFFGNLFHIHRVSLVQRLCSIIKQKYRYFFCNNFGGVDDYYVSDLDDIINKLNKTHHFDCCIVNYYYLTKVFKNISIPLKGLVTHDYFAYKSLLVGDRNVSYNIKADQEAIAMQRSPHIFALNSEEAIYFSKLSPLSKVYTIYSTYEYKPSMIVGNHTLLFLSGSNQYNLNGLNWFLNDIFPILKHEFKDVRLLIGGAICIKIQNFVTDDNIELLGYVHNADVFYSLGDVVINPTFQGTGLKIKTFEALSYDKVTMCHPHSTIGIYPSESVPIFFSKNPNEWVKYLRNIWSDEKNILKVKLQNRRYLESMQNFIELEYDRFFNSKKQ